MKVFTDQYSNVSDPGKGQLTRTTSESFTDQNSNVSDPGKGQLTRTDCESFHRSE